MKHCFHFEADRVVAGAATAIAGIQLFIDPGPDEKKEVLEHLSLPPHQLESALDADEISKVSFSPSRLSIIWKQPKNVSIDEQFKFDVGSMGLFLQHGQLTVILSECPPSFTAPEFQGSTCAMDVLLRLLDHTIVHYLGHLKVIKQITVELGAKITFSMENQYLLQMLALSGSLIYYINAIEANGGVLAKLQSHAQQLDLSPRQLEALHDLAADNHQCARQARIYSDVVSGLMETRGTIISNNVSVLLKKLTLISIIFLPLNLLASIGGMSEFSMMTTGIDWRISYSLFLLCLVLLGWGSWHSLVHILERRPAKRRPSPTDTAVGATANAPHFIEL